MAKSIGIDLGTTNSVAAIRKVKTEIIKNSEGDAITPSCVTIGKKGILQISDLIIGRDALEWKKQNPQNTITAVKRLMGRNFDDIEIQKLIQSKFQQYKISEYGKGSRNSIAVTLNDSEYTPQEISAEILKKIKRDSEKILKDKIEYAVITVPAYFNDKQKHATRTAATLAGLKVRRLLPEPTAAAISFGVDEINADYAENIIIFDFGGGTFDLSILTISGGQFIEQGKGGDMWLGGDDIDKLILDYALKSFAEENDIDDIDSLIETQNIKRKNLFIGELQAAVEKAKISLTKESVAYIEVSGILKSSDGIILDMDIEITREKFDELIADITAKIVKLTKDLIVDIDFSDDLIDKILLVGGSARIPAVIQAMKKEFGDEKIILHERPMLAVAEGAAILSHRLSDTYECPQCGKTVRQDDTVCEKCKYDLESNIIEQGVFDIVHTTAHDYYIRLENGEKHLFIEKNTPLPCETYEEFSLVCISQQLVHLQFSNTVNDTSEEIGELWLGLNFDLEEVLPKDVFEKIIQNEDENIHIKVKMSIDENNLIEINAKILEVPDVVISKTLSRGGEDEKMFYNIEKIIEDVNAGKYSEDTIKFIPARLASIAEDVNNIIDKKTALTDDGMLEKASMKLAKTKKMIKNNIPPIEGNIRYVKKILQIYGDIVPNDLRKKSLSKLTEVEAAYENAKYEEELKVMDSFREFLITNFEDLQPMMTLRKSVEVLEFNNLPGLNKQRRLLNDLRDAYAKGDKKKFSELISSNMEEIMKAQEIFIDIATSIPTTIHKGINVK